MKLSRILTNWKLSPIATLPRMIKYGVRLPIRSGMTPLTECEVGSKKKIEGESPAYWFVNYDQSVKVKLITKSINDKKEIISGIGRDSGIFKYIIRRK